MYLKKKILMPVVLLVTSMIVTIVVVQQVSLTSPLPADYELSQSIKSGISTKNTYTNNNQTVRITRTQPLEQASANQWVSTDQKIFEGLYTAAISPYPGAISDSITCPDELIPTIQNAPQYDYTHVFANDRMIYGICDPKEISYQSLILWQICSDWSVSKIEVFQQGQTSPLLAEEFSKYLCS